MGRVLVRSAAAERGTSLQDFLLDAITARAVHLRRRAALARAAERLHSRPGVPGPERVAVLDAVDAVGDPGPGGAAAREALAAQPPEERLEAPGHHAIEVVSGLRAAADRPDHPLRYADAVHLAAAERRGTALLTADARIARSGAPIACQVVTVGATGG